MARVKIASVEDEEPGDYDSYQSTLDYAKGNIRLFARYRAHRDHLSGWSAYESRELLKDYLKTHDFTADERKTIVQAYNAAWRVYKGSVAVLHGSFETRR